MESLNDVSWNQLHNLDAIIQRWHVLGNVKYMSMVLSYLLRWNFLAIVREMAAFSNSRKLQSDKLIHRFHFYVIFLCLPAARSFPAHEIGTPMYSTFCIYSKLCPLFPSKSKSCELGKVRLFWLSIMMYAQTRFVNTLLKMYICLQYLARVISNHFRFSWKSTTSLSAFWSIVNWNHPAVSRSSCM